MLAKPAHSSLANHPELDLNGKNKGFNFSDQNEIKEQYLDSVKLCIQQGFIQGYPDTTFKPENTLTRAEACTVPKMQGVRGDKLLLMGPKLEFKTVSGGPLDYVLTTGFYDPIN